MIINGVLFVGVSVLVREKRPTFEKMVKETEDMIVSLGSKGRFPSGGQLVVLVKEVIFPKLRLTNSDAGKVVNAAKRSLGIR